MKAAKFGFGVLLALIVVYLGLDYLGRIPKSRFSSQSTTIPASDFDGDPVPYTIEEVVSDLEVPWSIVFTSPDRVLVTERKGTIRVIENGDLVPEPLITLPEVESSGEEGLMGMALDPDYENNKFFYVCYAYSTNGQLKDKVVRLVDEGSSAKVVAELLSGIPSAVYHAGCRVKVGPDDKLYVTTGDAGEKADAQDTKSLAGKILRMNTDGTIPSDNPFPNLYVYSYGHRNPQGLSWDSFGNLYSTEHGPSGFDGPGGGDEVNLIEAGENYGWPVVSHEKSREGMVDPLTIYTPAVAPGSALVYSGKMFPQFAGNLFFGGLRGEGLYRLLLVDKKVSGTEQVSDVDFGRIRDVVESPTGEIWFSTSNLDGRGNIREGDDKIYKLSTQ